jgi:hypothetical protein
MTIQRFETGPRMSQAVVHGNTVFLAGVVAKTTAGASVSQGRQRQVEIADGDDLHYRHEDVSRDERGVGRLGVGGQHARPRHGRGQARGAAI